MKAVGPPDGLTAYLERLGEPAVIVSTENRQPLGTLQDQQCVWRSKAAIESAILCKSDIQALNNLVEEIVSGPSLSKQAGGWEGTRLDSSHIVLRRIQSFEPDDHATLVDNLEQNLVLGHEGFPDVPKSEPAVDQHPRVNVFVELAEHDEVAQSVLNYNWAATTLGPMEQWDPCVESAVYSLLVYPWPACICLGEQHHLIYNKAYSYILGAPSGSLPPLRLG